MQPKLLKHTEKYAAFTFYYFFALFLCAAAITEIQLSGPQQADNALVSSYTNKTGLCAKNAKS